MIDDNWTIKELATYLKLKEKTVYSLAAKGELPGFKVGGSWRFSSNAIEKWIKEQSRSVKT